VRAAVTSDAGRAEPQRRVGGGKAAQSCFLQLPELYRVIARKADGVLDRNRLRQALDACGFELREIELELVGAGDPAHRPRKIVEPDDAEFAVLLEGERA